MRTHMIKCMAIGMLLAIVMTASSQDDAFPEPGGVYGGTYVPWGMPPFVEHETPPPPGGAFEGKRLSWAGQLEISA